MENKARYAAACKRCAAGQEPVRREYFPGKFLWLHDSVVACNAHQLREEDRHRAAVAAQQVEGGQ